MRAASADTAGSGTRPFSARPAPRGQHGGPVRAERPPPPGSHRATVHGAATARHGRERGRAREGGGGGGRLGDRRARRGSPRATFTGPGFADFGSGQSL